MKVHHVMWKPLLAIGTWNILDFSKIESGNMELDLHELDLRTNVEVGATDKVLDGDLDPFMEASLKAGL